MFHVGSRHLETAFHRHRSLGEVDEPNDSHLLLLLYAVECGLKRLLLKRRGLHSTERLEDDDLTHDLDALLKKLGMRERFGSYRADPGGLMLGVKGFHEVFRYGGRFAEEVRPVIIHRARNVLAQILENGA